MLFYGSTNLFGDRGVLEYVVKIIGPEMLLELISEGLLNVYFVESHGLIIPHQQSNGRVAYTPDYFKLNVEHPFYQALRTSCVESVGKEGRGRRLASKIESHLKLLRLEKGVLAGTSESILNAPYLQSAVRKVIADLLPGSRVDDIVCLPNKTSDGIEIATNLNLDVLNATYKQRVPDDKNQISVASILTNIFDAECDMYFASKLWSEIATTPVGSKLISERASHLANTINHNNEQIAQFEDFVLDETLPIREAINSGTLSFDNALKLLKGARKFRHWISGVPYDKKLVAEYIKEITKESVTDKLPSRFVRWAIFLGIGFAVDGFIGGDLGKAIGADVGAFDTFLVDRLIKSWKPSQFIDEYKGVVKRS
jgi:hypothetical protein